MAPIPVRPGASSSSSAQRRSGVRVWRGRSRVLQRRSQVLRAPGQYWSSSSGRRHDLPRPSGANHGPPESPLASIAWAYISARQNAFGKVEARHSQPIGRHGIRRARPSRHTQSAMSTTAAVLTAEMTVHAVCAVPRAESRSMPKAGSGSESHNGNEHPHGQRTEAPPVGRASATPPGAEHDRRGLASRPAGLPPRCGYRIFLSDDPSPVDHRRGLELDGTDRRQPPGLAHANDAQDSRGRRVRRHAAGRLDVAIVGRPRRSPNPPRVLLLDRLAFGGRRHLNRGLGPDCPAPAPRRFSARSLGGLRTAVAPGGPPERRCWSAPASRLRSARPAGEALVDAGCRPGLVSACSGSPRSTSVSTTQPMCSPQPPWASQLPSCSTGVLAPEAVFPIAYRTGKSAHLDVTGARGKALRLGLRTSAGNRRNVSRRPWGSGDPPGLRRSESLRTAGPTCSGSCTPAITCGPTAPTNFFERCAMADSKTNDTSHLFAGLFSTRTTCSASCGRRELTPCSQGALSKSLRTASTLLVSEFIQGQEISRADHHACHHRRRLGDGRPVVESGTRSSRHQASKHSGRWRSPPPDRCFVCRDPTVTVAPSG